LKADDIGLLCATPSWNIPERKFMLSAMNPTLQPGRNGPHRCALADDMG
jgi:hypothetical protein